MEDFSFLDSERFTIQRQLGAGGMGVVYLAHDAQRDQDIALKTLKRMSPSGLLLFKNEFRVLADLQHPNLIRLYELFEGGGTYFFSMELLSGAKEFIDYIRGEAALDGATLAQSQPSAITLLTGEEPGAARTLSSAQDVAWDDSEAFTQPAASARYDEVRLRESFRQLALGLSALHSANKVHRDIKPSNVLVVEESKEDREKRAEEEQRSGPRSSLLSPLSVRVVLMDFGLVTEASSGTSRSQLVGTPLYMAPEQASAQGVGPAADWYSVGVMLFEALTGSVPFSGSLQKILMQKFNEDPQPPSALLPGLPEDLSQLCFALMQRDPGARPTGAEVLRRLGASQEEPNSAPDAGEHFVGRSEELRALEEALRESRKGSAVAQIVYGESGLGKSRLIRYFLASPAVREGAVVLSGRCYEQEQVPYKAFDGIVDALCRHLLALAHGELATVLPPGASLLGRVFPVLKQVPGIEEDAITPTSDPGELRGKAFTALRGLFTRMAALRPLVLFIDDLQWSDQDSLLLLDDLLRPPSGAYLIVASARGVREELLGERGPLRSLKKMPGSLRHMALARLPLDDAKALVRQLSKLSPEEAESLLREAEGHPLFLQELALHSGPTTTTGSAVARLDDILWARVGRLEEQARQLLELLAVSGAPLAQKTLAHAAGQTQSEFVRRVEGLRAQLLARTLGRLDTDPIEPYHDRVRESVVARLSAATRTQHHLRLAESLEEAQAEPRTLLRHFEAAGEYARAAVYAKQAAERARSAFAFDQVAEFLKAALRLGKHSPEEMQQLRLSLAETLASAGRGVESAEVFLSIAESAEPRLRFDCRRRAAEQLLASGELQRGIALTNEVLTELGEGFLSEREVLPSLLWNLARFKLRGLKYTLVEESRASQQDLWRLDVYQSILYGISPIQPMTGGAYTMKQVRLALDVGEPRRLGEALLAAVVMNSINGPKSAEYCWELFGAAETALQRVTDRAYAEGNLGFVKGSVLALSEGHVGRALRALQAAEPLLLQSPDGIVRLRGARMMELSLLGYFQGDYQRINEWGRSIYQDAVRRKDRYSSFAFIRHSAIAFLAADKPEELKREFQAHSWSPIEDGYHMQHIFELRADGDLALYQGEGRRLLERVKQHRKLLPFSIKAVLHGAVTLWAAALRLSLAAVQSAKDPLVEDVLFYCKQLEATAMPCALPQARMARAALALHQRNTPHAITLLREAVSLTDAEEMLDHAAAARYRLGQVIGGEEGAAMLLQGKEAFQRLGVKRPERMVEVTAPGFGSLR